MKKLLWIILIAMAMAVPVFAATMGTVVAEWDPNPEQDIAGYVLYYGPDSGIYDNEINIPVESLVNGVTEHDVEIDLTQTTYFAMRAYNKSGLHSELSKEAVWHSVAAPLAPILRMIRLKIRL